MAHTTSLSYPNLFDVARNTVAVKEDNDAIVNRTRLLMLTDPTELYNSPTFGVGLKRYLWQYNTANTKAIIEDRIKEQLAEHEPYVDAEMTSFADGLLFSESNNDVPSLLSDMQQLKMTVGLQTIYEEELNVQIDLEAERNKMFSNTQEV